MECHGANCLLGILTMKQVSHILNVAVGQDWQLLRSEIKPATPGICGFVGDHFRVTLHIKHADCINNLKLFVKCMPLANEPKAKTIDEQNFYRREMIMFDLFEKMGVSNEPNPWCVKAYIYTEKIVVMPDLLYRGYRQHPPLDCLDIKHILLATTSIARFHATFANYENKRVLNGHLPFDQEYVGLLQDPMFSDSPWLHAAAKLTKNFIAAFSDNCGQYPANLEDVLVKLYIEACGSFTKCDSLNVINHKDLWINNIMFRYEGESPTNALLIDFQCIRYGPPAFDLMIFLYLNTSRSFRKLHEIKVLRHYFVIFLENLKDSTRKTLQMLKYDYDDFVAWCQKARMFGMLVSMTIFPYALMEPTLAQKTFDDPKTFLKYCNVDRTEPVVAHAMECSSYRQRQLEVSEEFVERYALKHLCSSSIKS